VTPRPKTIQIYLPGGDPRGIRVAEITTRIVQVIEVPRSLLADFLKMRESTQVAVYFLVGEDEDGGDPRAYVGQSGDLRTRLAKHNSEKDFWQRALVVISLTNSITQTHALFLEWYCLQAVKSVGRFADENGNKGTRPFTPAPLEADCLEIFETAHALLATLGYPLFDPVAKPSDATLDNELLYCTSSDASGRGMFTQDGFVVFAGSKGRHKMVPSFHGTSSARMRMAMIDSGALQVEGDMIVFTKDHLFRTPSGAAIALMGRTANGWLEWRNAAGQTLDALKRQGVDE